MLLTYLKNIFFSCVRHIQIIVYIKRRMKKMAASNNIQNIHLPVLIVYYINFFFSLFISILYQRNHIESLFNTMYSFMELFSFYHSIFHQSYIQSAITCSKSPNKIFYMYIKSHEKIVLKDNFFQLILESMSLKNILKPSMLFFSGSLMSFRPFIC